VVCVDKWKPAFTFTFKDGYAYVLHYEDYYSWLCTIPPIPTGEFIMQVYLELNN
jgi:hypothetical protein